LFCLLILKVHLFHSPFLLAAHTAGDY